MSSCFSAHAGRPSRPFGIWLAAGYAVLFAAFMPLFTHLWALTFPPHSGFEEITLPHLLHTAGMSLSIAFFAILAWRGNNRGRIALLVLLTVYYAMIAFENSIWLSANVNNPDLMDMFFMRMARAITVPAIFVWYFTEPGIKAFYHA
jgi:hypothetical protein